MPTAPRSDDERNEPSLSIQILRLRPRLAAPPRPLLPLLGRDAELAAVSVSLAQGDVRLVTLVGPGGIGKTRLALGIAAEVAEAFDGQVAWAPVATAKTSDALVAALAQAVGVAEAGGAPVLESVKAALRDARLLLVIDNVEQVLDAAPFLSELLQACPRLSILVTSRALLRIAGEHPIDAPPLATASNALGTDTAPAVQLFTQHATSVYPAFALIPDNAPVVAEICRKLDGLPLAIELAAARSRLLTPVELLARLDRRLPNLTAGQRDAPARHRTMRDAIDWSYGLLSPAEQSVFRCMSTFVGGCTLEAAEAVCRAPLAGDDGLSNHDTVFDTTEAIESLVTQSLVQIEPASANVGKPRVSMLETVREFAAEQLLTSGDRAPGRRHAEYYLGMALRAEPTYSGDLPGYGLSGIEREIANLRSAREWAVEHGEADMALRLTAAMFDPHRITGDNAREQWEWTQRALALPGGSPEAKVAALAVAAWAAQVRSDELDARELGKAALALARQVGDVSGIADAASALGTVRLHAGDVDAARQLLTEALDGFRSLGAAGRTAWTLCHLAYLDSHDAIDEGGDLETLGRALACYDEALALFRQIGHPRGIARSLHGVAYVTFKMRDLPQALASTQEVLALDWEQRWPALFSYLEDIADIAGRTGQPATAARLYSAADAQREQLGLPIDPPFRAEYDRDVAVARRALGEAAFAAGWAAGRALTEEQAVAEALAVSIGPEAEATGINEASSVSLSPRELEVMRLLATGLSDRAIGETLFIGERTVNTHVAHIFAKLGVRNRAAAVITAVAAGLVDPNSVGTGSSQAD